MPRVRRSAIVPLITTVPIADPEAIIRTAGETQAAATPRWVAFTSATAARLVLGAAGRAAISGLLVAAVGPATAAALHAAGVEPDLVAGEYDAAGLASSMLERGVSGGSVWLPVAEGAGGGLAEALRSGGAAVTVQRIYRSDMPESRLTGFARLWPVGSTRSPSPAAAPRDISCRLSAGRHFHQPP